MTRRELIERMADRLQVPEHSAQVFLHAFFDVSKSMLRSGETVALGALGTWTPEHDPDGVFRSVIYAPSHAASPVPVGEDIVSGPASSIDSRHFIPAEALAIAHPSGRSPVDVADIVIEVQRGFAEEAPMEETPVEEAPADAAPEEESVEDEYPGEEEYIEEAVPGDTDAGDMLTDEGDFLEEDFDEVEAEGMEAESMEGHGIEDDEVEDDAVFHRNRDQLYHPPEERSNRALLFVALGLTLVVLIIILSLLFGSDEKASFGDRRHDPNSATIPSAGTWNETAEPESSRYELTANTVKLTIQRSI